MDALPFDKRRYPVVSVEAGYAEWAVQYDATVAVGLDRPLLERLHSVNWGDVRMAADLACGTGRTGEWLRAKGVARIDGVDLTPEMLEQARAKNVYDDIFQADLAATSLQSSSYDLCMLVLADEHLAELGPAYKEAARLIASKGKFVLLGYHPFFLMGAMPTHFHRASREAVTIRSYVHLFSEHFKAGTSSGLELGEFHECVIDDGWLKTKPKWREYLHWPVSFVMVWSK
jgi:SAM-dependent methyltransferase